MCRPGAVALRAGRVHASRALHCGGVGSPRPRDVARFGTGRRVKPAKAATRAVQRGVKRFSVPMGNRHAIDGASKRLPRTGFPFRKGGPCGVYAKAIGVPARKGGPWWLVRNADRVRAFIPHPPAPPHPPVDRMTTDGTRRSGRPRSLPSTRRCARKVDVAGDHESEADDEMLRAFLRDQRESVLAIVEGLDEEAWYRSVVPT